jgi:PRC-barrel domain
MSGALAKRHAPGGVPVGTNRAGSGFTAVAEQLQDTMAIEASEQGNLIGSDKVEGTAVYDADNNKIGSIERVMIEKTSGKISYAVPSFGGFLDMGNDYFPLPWHSLAYDPDLNGYVTNLTEAQLKGAPKYNADNNWNWNDAGSTRSVDDYYRL